MTKSLISCEVLWDGRLSSFIKYCDLFKKKITNLSSLVNAFSLLKHLPRYFMTLSPHKKNSLTPPLMLSVTRNSLITWRRGFCTGLIINNTSYCLVWETLYYMTARCCSTQVVTFWRNIHFPSPNMQKIPATILHTYKVRFCHDYLPGLWFCIQLD